MPMSNAMRNAIHDLVFEGVDPAWRAGATGYLALVTGLSIDLDNPMTNECDYTGYARLPCTKASAFIGTGITRTNAALLQWGKRTDGGATQKAHYVIWCDTASGAVTSLSVIGILDSDINIDFNSRPQAEPSEITWTCT